MLDFASRNLSCKLRPLIRIQFTLKLGRQAE
jgi:hypothetical protein